MLTERYFLEWGWGALESFQHPSGWLVISAAGLSSANFPAPSGLLLAAPDDALCLKEMAGSGKGALTDSMGKTCQPQCSKITRRVDKEVVGAGCGPRCSEPEIALTLLAVRALCYKSWCFRAPCPEADKSVCTAPAMPEWSAWLPATGVLLCKWAGCYNVSI